MSSTSRSFNQRLTNKLVSTGVFYLFPEGNVANAAIVGNATVNGAIVLVPSVSDLSGYLHALSGTYVTSRETLTDLGVTFRLGIQGVNNEMIIFRLVQRSNTKIVDQGAGDIGYVVVENNILGEDNNSGGLLELNNFVVAVARVS